MDTGHGCVGTVGGFDTGVAAAFKKHIIVTKPRDSCYVVDTVVANQDMQR
jgi:hypothetical protein